MKSTIAIDSFNTFRNGDRLVFQGDASGQIYTVANPWWVTLVEWMERLAFLNDLIWPWRSRQSLIRIER